MNLFSATTPRTGRVLSSRSSLIRAAADVDLPAGVTVVDRWSADERWEEHLVAATGDAAAEGTSTATPVVLSSLGVDQPDTPYLRVLAGREEAARSRLDSPTVLRLAPVVEDLEVYAAPLAAGETVFHAYADQPAAWLSATDVLRFAAQVVEHPTALGGTYDLRGPATTPPLDLLTAWAEATDSRSTFAAVPVDVLTVQLGAVLGADTAAAVVGHQQWCGSAAVTGADPAESALTRALADPVPWPDALERLAAPHP